jgi:hypothetical protein
MENAVIGCLMVSTQLSEYSAGCRSYKISIVRRPCRSAKLADDDILIPPTWMQRDCARRLLMRPEDLSE